MSPFQFDSDMSDVSTTPVGLPDLGDLGPLPLVRQRAEPRDPLEIDASTARYPAARHLIDHFPRGVCSRCSVHDRTPAGC